MRQTGGRGQYGHCRLRLESWTDPEGKKNLLFKDEVVGGVIPREFIPAIGK